MKDVMKQLTILAISIILTSHVIAQSPKSNMSLANKIAADVLPPNSKIILGEGKDDFYIVANNTKPHKTVAVLKDNKVVSPHRIVTATKHKKFANVAALKTKHKVVAAFNHKHLKTVAALKDNKVVVKHKIVAALAHKKFANHELHRSVASNDHKKLAAVHHIKSVKHTLTHTHRLAYHTNKKVLTHKKVHVASVKSKHTKHHIA